MIEIFSARYNGTSNSVMSRNNGREPVLHQWSEIVGLAMQDLPLDVMGNGTHHLGDRGLAFRRSSYLCNRPDTCDSILLSDELDLSSVLGDTRAYLYSPVLG